MRGYPYNFLVRDNGFSVSLEGRIPIFRLPIPGISKSSSDGMVAFAPFIDYGRSWNRDAPTGSISTLAGIGAGLRWSISERAQANIYFAHQLKDVPDPVESNLQDDGIFFSVVYNAF